MKKKQKFKLKIKNISYHDPVLKDVVRGIASSQSTGDACTSATSIFLFPALSPRLLHTALLNLLNAIVDVD